MSLQSNTTKLINRRLLRNPAIGGHSTLIVGPSGCGKTSLMLTECELFMKKYPNELVFWRDSENSICQFNRIPNYKIFVEKGCNIRFRNMSSGGKIEVPYKVFNSFNDLIDYDTGEGLAELQHLNVVYFKETYTWIDFLDHLRTTINWQSVFIDELEDLCPLNPSRRDYESRNFRMEKNLKFSDSIKQIRKGLVNMVSNTQNHYEVDWRVKSKMNYIIYLAGAKLDDNSRIKQVAVDTLGLGEAFIELEHRRFGKLSFKGYEPRHPLLEAVIPVNR